jgi:hydrogenase expression/formation protein HypC
MALKLPLRIKTMCLAVPGKVLEAVDARGSRIAKVQFGGITRQVCLDFVPEVQIGDYVIVHVGFAIGKVDEEEAKRAYEYLEQAGLLDEGGSAP